MRDWGKPPEWLAGPASAVLRDLQGAHPIDDIAVMALPMDDANGLHVAIVEGHMLTNPLEQLDDDLDPDEPTDYGGGTPVVDVWRRDYGLATGHVETVPKLVALSSRADRNRTLSSDMSRTASELSRQ